MNFLPQTGHVLACPISSALARSSALRLSISTSALQVGQSPPATSEAFIILLQRGHWARSPASSPGPNLISVALPAHAHDSVICRPPSSACGWAR